MDLDRPLTYRLALFGLSAGALLLVLAVPSVMKRLLPRAEEDTRFVASLSLWTLLFVGGTIAVWQGGRLEQAYVPLGGAALGFFLAMALMRATHAQEIEAFEAGQASWVRTLWKALFWLCVGAVALGGLAALLAWTLSQR
ncbi:MAG TPA: hypothetical protein VGM19_06515 [Armatimonadota bacterium]